MSALTILRAASRDVANERYVEVMEAIDAFAELVEADAACNEAARRLAQHHEEAPFMRRDAAWHETNGRLEAEADQAEDRRAAALTRCGVPA